MWKDIPQELSIESWETVEKNKKTSGSKFTKTIGQTIGSENVKESAIPIKVFQEMNSYCFTSKDYKLKWKYLLFYNCDSR